MTTGIDIVNINRIADLTERHEAYLPRFYTKAELTYCNHHNAARIQSLAGIFAAKEAFFKALRTGFRKGKWTEVEVCHDELGAPYFMFYGYYADIMADSHRTTPALSISHDGDYATAIVIME